MAVHVSWKQFTVCASLYLICCALGGLVTTVAVAWGLAAWLPHTHLMWNAGSLECEKDDEALEFSEFSRPGMARSGFWRVHLGGSNFGGLPLEDAYVGTRVPHPDEPDITWGLLSPARGPDGPRASIQDGRGWPSLALWCELPIPNINGYRIVAPPRGGFSIARHQDSIDDFRALPYRPIWRGLLIDTAAYAPGWAVLLGLARFHPLRRVIRRRRNQCSVCGYAVAGLAPGAACPECGLVRP